MKLKLHEKSEKELIAIYTKIVTDRQKIFKDAIESATETPKE